jgi:hypothetical protein
MMSTKRGEEKEKEEEGRKQKGRRLYKFVVKIV